MAVKSNKIGCAQLLRVSEREKWHNWSYIPRIFWVRFWCKHAARPTKCRSMQRKRCPAVPRVPEYWIASSKSPLIPFSNNVLCSWGSYDGADDVWGSRWWDFERRFSPPVRGGGGGGGQVNLITKLINFGHHGAQRCTYTQSQGWVICGTHRRGYTAHDTRTAPRDRDIVEKKSTKYKEEPVSATAVGIVVAVVNQSAIWFSLLLR